MKRKIEDYINKGDYAVLCSSIEEWNAIVDLINKNHVSTTIQPYSKTKANVLNLQNLRVTIGTGTLKTYPSYTIYPASDFLEEESKFEEGKWYYIELGVHKHYLKFKKIDKDKAFLDNKGYINHLKKWDYGVSIVIGKVTFYRLLTDLSEIQEFLPDNHPDKIKIEIIPEYVECINWYGNLYINGIIYKVSDLKPSTKPFDGHKYCFKPSTKEAFDLQNKPKQLTGYNLLPNEIYVTTKPTAYIFKTSETGRGYSHYIYQFNSYNSISPNKDYIWTGNLRLAPNEEKKWLNTCISQNKFIPKKDLHLYDDSGLLIKKEKINDILEEAKERYPIGTKFRCAKDRESAIVEEKLIQDHQGFIYTTFTGNRLNQYVYANNKWAEIISLPNEECIPKVDDWCVTTTHYNDEIWYKGRVWQIGRIDEEGFCIPIQNGKLLDQSLKIGFRKALPHEIPIQYPLAPKESFKTEIYDFGDIYIPSIIKKQTKLQTITIESTTDLNLGIKTIKSKQIQTIKI